VRRRVLAISEAGDAYPSGVIRSMIYRDLFARHGYDARFVSRMHPGVRRFMDTPPPLLAPVVSSQAGRALFAAERWIARAREPRILEMARDADVVYLSKVVSHPFVARLRAVTKARLVLDIVDALWLPRHRNERLGEVLSLVDAVTTDNEVTAAGLRRHRAEGVVVIPDSPQVELFEARRAAVRRGEPGRLIIGWVGSVGTTYNLREAWEVLERVFTRHPHLHLRLLGADPRALPPFEKVRWSLARRYSQAEMIDEVLGMDVGIFPLQDDEACRARGVLKAAVYMAGGAAVIASPVGVTAELVRPGETGLLASTPGEWEDALERLIGDAALRARLSGNGLEVVRREFTVARAFDRLRAVLDPESESVNQ
jgi:glycosyltransferase involved in cell wall biosynthesis